mgnify:CR=1 FL=1
MRLGIAVNEWNFREQYRLALEIVYEILLKPDNRLPDCFAKQLEKQDNSLLLRLHANPTKDYGEDIKRFQELEEAIRNTKGSIEAVVLHPPKKISSRDEYIGNLAGFVSQMANLQIRVLLENGGLYKNETLSSPEETIEIIHAVNELKMAFDLGKAFEYLLSKGLDSETARRKIEELLLNHSGSIDEVHICGKIQNYEGRAFKTTQLSDSMDALRPLDLNGLENQLIIVETNQQIEKLFEEVGYVKRRVRKRCRQLY